MHPRTSALLLAVLSLGLSTPSAAQIVFNPQIGVSASQLSTYPAGTTGESRTGFQIGGTLRIGGRLHLMPGVFWQQSGMQYTFLVWDGPGRGPSSIKSRHDLNAVRTSLGVGYTLLEKQAVSLRTHAGIALSGVYKVDFTDSRLSRDNFSTVLVDLPIGAGVDILKRISLDLTYELGVNNVIDSINGQFDGVIGLPSEGKNNVFRMNVGVVF